MELTQFTVKLPPALLKQLRIKAAKEETSLQTLVEALLETGLKWIDKSGK